jgi:hypothetical protein
MGWIESESFWFFGPDFADIFERREPLSVFRRRVIVGVDEVSEVSPKLVVVVILGSPDGHLLDGLFHPLESSVRLGDRQFCINLK